MQCTLRIGVRSMHTGGGLSATRAGRGPPGGREDDEGNDDNDVVEDNDEEVDNVDGAPPPQSGAS